MLQAAQRLRETLFFYRSQFFPLAGILLPVVLPACLLMGYRACVVLNGDPLNLQQDLPFLLLGTVTGLFASAATIILAVSVLEGQVLNARDVRLQAAMAMPGLLLVQVLLFCSVGLLAILIVPALWLMGCLAPAMVLVVAEKQTVLQSLKNSMERFRPMAWRILLALVLLMLFLLLVMLVLEGLQMVSQHWPVMPRVAAWAVLQTVSIMLSQLFSLMLVRFYDLQRQPA